MQKEYILNRSGVIVTNPNQATNFQCVKKGHNKYYYWVQVIFKNPVLDERGFLADHTDLDNFVIEQVQGGEIPSCELMIDKVAIAVAKWLAGKSMPAVSVYAKFASTHEGSEGFIEGTIFPTDSDNEVWKDRASGALSMGALLAKNLISGDAIGKTFVEGFSNDHAYPFAPLKTVPSIEERQEEESGRQCAMGTRRFKTIKEIFDTPGVEINASDRVVNIQSNNTGYLTMQDLEYLRSLNMRILPNDSPLRLGYYEIRKPGDVTKLIPIWATTCKPLN